MAESIIRSYYKFFDETIESTTFIVLFITLIIFFVWAVVPNAHAETQFLKTSILEAKLTKKYIETSNIVVIDGIKYELYFSRLAD